MPPYTLTPKQELAIQDYFDSLGVYSDAKREKHCRLATFRILALGAAGTGKKSICLRITLQIEPPEEYDPTGPDTYRQQVIIHNDYGVMLEYDSLCDTTIDACTAMWNQYLKTSDAFLLVYSVSSKESFKRLRSLYRVRFEESREAKPKPVWILANKSDLPKELWEVETQDGQDFASSIGAKFLSVSAMTGECLQRDDAVRIATELLLHRVEGRAEEDVENRVEECARRDTSRSGWSLQEMCKNLRRMVGKEAI